MNLTNLVSVSTLCLAASVASADIAIETLVEETGVETGPKPVREMPGWEAPDKILLPQSLGPELTASLQQEFPSVQFIGYASPAEAVDDVEGVDAVIGTCSAEILDAGHDVVWVQIFSAGADRCVPVESIRRGDVLLTNMQKMSSPVLAEHAVAMVAALARGLVMHSKAMASGQWQRRGPMTENMQSISGKTLLVVGLGGIGTEVARRAAALGMRVTGTRRSSREGPDFVDYVGLSSELHELAAEADFIVNALPLTPETTGIFNAEFFAAAKPGMIFVSVGRGKSTVTADLIAALESGQVAGAGLDVTDPEPLPADHPLWQVPNVLITPHIAGVGGTRERHAVLLRENLRRFIDGDALYNVVDPNAGY